MQAMTTTPNRDVRSAMEPGVRYRFTDLAERLGYGYEEVDLLASRLESAEAMGTIVRESRNDGKLNLWRLP